MYIVHVYTYTCKWGGSPPLYTFMQSCKIETGAIYFLEKASVCKILYT